MDPFLQVFDEQRTSKIHIRVQQQGKRWITTIDGLDDDLDIKRIARAMKKALHCSIIVTPNKDDEEVIQLQGDHRDAVREWLIANEVLTEQEAKERLLVHGA